MKINEDYDSNDLPQDSEVVMDAAMGWIHDNLIAPIEKDLSEDQAFMLTMIGASFRILAQKAHAYDQIEVQGNKESPYIKN